MLKSVLNFALTYYRHNDTLFRTTNTCIRLVESNNNADNNHNKFIENVSEMSAKTDVNLMRTEECFLLPLRLSGFSLEYIVDILRPKSES